KVDIVANRLQGFRTVRHRQQVIIVMAIDDTPGEMLRNQARFEPVVEVSQSSEMIAIEALCGTNREADAVATEIISLTNLFDRLEAWSQRRQQVIFAMNLQPGEIGLSLVYLRQMRVPQPDRCAGKRSGRGSHHRHVRGERHGCKYMRMTI